MIAKVLNIRYLPLILILIMSCAPLKRSQVRLVNNYFNTIAKYPGNFRLLNERVATYELEARNLESALYPSDSARVEALLISIEDFEIHVTFPDTIVSEMEKIESYIQGYFVLVPNGFNIYKALRSTSVSIVDIFGLGSVASSVIPDANLEITAVRKQKIKDHFDNNGETFTNSLSKIQHYIDSELVPSIEKVEEDYSSEFKQLFQDGLKPVSSIDHYFQYNNHFIMRFQQIIATKKYAHALSASISNVIESEGEVKKLIRDRAKIEKNSKELHQLALDLQKLSILAHHSQFTR